MEGETRNGAKKLLICLGSYTAIMMTICYLEMHSHDMPKLPRQASLSCRAGEATRFLSACSGSRNRTLLNNSSFLFGLSFPADDVDVLFAHPQVGGVKAATSCSYSRLCKLKRSMAS